ncbi:hypothetical protein BH23CHL2_BH23CHL2_27530 [soil metagenome]
MATLFDRSIRCPIVIGRDPQLAVLTRAFEQVAAQRGQTLLVAGEAGIGKSRLVAEAKAIAGRQDWLIIEGHSFEPERIVPYAPLVDLLRNLLPNLSPSEITELLGAEARDLVKILPELARSLSDLNPASGLDPAQERQLAIQSFVTSMLRLSNRRPVLAIIEDLHWSDDTSLDALLHLARRLANNPILLVMTYRDDEVDSELRHVLATIDRERLALELPLRRLDAAEVGAMIGAIVSGRQPVHPSFRDALHALTDGNPFFIEEVLNSLRRDDDGLSSRSWRDHTTLDALHIPRSVHDAVQRRVEGLSPNARNLLHLASVSGRRCDFSLLQTLTGHDEPELLQLVKELVEAQLLVEEIEDRFAFRHALTQKTVYTSLLSRERRQLHRAIVEAYEQLPTVAKDRHVADLAYHCYEAGDWRRALEYASDAGEQAMDLYVPQAAVEQFSRALDAALRLSRTPAPRLYRARGRSYETLGDFEHACADYESALNVARASQDQRDEWRALLDLGLLWAGRDYEQSAEYCQRALTLARAIGDPVILAHSLNRIGNWYTNIARPREGLALHREALEISNASGDQATIAETIDLLGIASYVAGDSRASLDYYTRALEHCRETDDRQGTSWCLSVMALCGGSYQTDAGATADITLDESERRARAAIALAREIGWRPGEAFAEHVCGMVHGTMGQYDQAFDRVQRSFNLSAEIGHRQWMIAGRCGLGVLYLELLDARQARSLLEQALEEAHAMGSILWVQTVRAVLARACLLDQDIEAARRVLNDAGLPDVASSGQGARNCWLARADLYLALGDAGKALGTTDALIATAPGLSSQREAPRLARLRGEALARLGLLEEAEAALDDAVQGAVAAGRPGHAWQAQLALGRFLRMQRRYSAADAAFEAARATVEAMAATVPDQTLREVFLTNAAGLLPESGKPTERQAIAQLYGGLTGRERDVAALVAQGMSNRVIADRLFVSQPTIASHVSHILAKLGFSSRTQIATWAIETGLLSDHLPDGMQS